jgi:hypothetical protein
MDYPVFKEVYIVTVVGHPAFSSMTLLSQKSTYKYEPTQLHHVSIRSLVKGFKLIAYKPHYYVVAGVYIGHRLLQVPNTRL